MHLSFTPYFSRIWNLVKTIVFQSMFWHYLSGTRNSEVKKYIVLRTEFNRIENQTSKMRAIVTALGLRQESFSFSGLLFLQAFSFSRFNLKWDVVSYKTKWGAFKFTTFPFHLKEKDHWRLIALNFSAYNPWRSFWESIFLLSLFSYILRKGCFGDNDKKIEHIN